MKIDRVNDYTDKNFDRVILIQHGAYYVDGVPFGFEIVNSNTAMIHTDLDQLYDLVIDRFRYHAFHITRFIDVNGILIKEFDSPIYELVAIKDVQPSQFYVNVDKVIAASSWINSKDDLKLPVVTVEGKLVLEDGHSRLYAAFEKGINEVYVYKVKLPDYLTDFMNEAIKRGINNISQLDRLSSEDYKELWIGYCNEYFSNS